MMDPSKLFCCNFPRKILLSDNRKSKQCNAVLICYLAKLWTEDTATPLMAHGEGRKTNVFHKTNNGDPILWVRSGYEAV